MALRLPDSKKSIVSLIFDIAAFAITLILFLFVEFILDGHVEPVFRGFYCNDESIKYPYQRHPAVPSWSLFVFNVFVPMAVIAGGAVYSAFYVNRGKTSGQPLTCGRVCIPQSVVRPLLWYLWYLMGIGLTIILTNILKFTQGKLRPHFLSVCDPDWSSIQCTDEFNNYIYVTNYTCRGDAGMVRQSRLSFPSGHASSTSFAMVFTASPCQLLLMGLSILLTLLCAGSRITDNCHYFVDVIVGLIIGAVVALVVVYYNIRYFGQCKTTHNKEDPEAINMNKEEEELNHDN